MEANSIFPVSMSPAAELRREAHSHALVLCRSCRLARWTALWPLPVSRQRDSSSDLLMSRLAFGGLAGLLFGVVSVALMLPLSFPDKRAALTGAFLNRFAIGLLIPLVALPGPGWAIGLGLGVLLSLPDAIITRALGPIVGVGALGGLLIGWLASHYATAM